MDDDRKLNRLPRLAAIDALRGVAALLVLLLHSPRLTGPLVALQPVRAMGWSGVGLFLVLSGFSIHFRWAASDVPHHRFSVGRFARRRFYRLYPTYAAAVVLAVIVSLALGRGVGFTAPWVFAAGNEPLFLALAAQITLVFANVVVLPYVGIGWSLALEVQLYGMYAALVRHLRSLGVLRVVAFGLGVAIIWRLGSEVLTSSLPVGQFFPDGHASFLSWLPYQQLPSRCFEWLLGMLAAEAYFGRVRLPKACESPIVAGALFVLAAALFRHPLGAASINGHPFMVSDVLLDPLIGLTYCAVVLSLIYRDQRLTSHPVGGPIVRAFASVGLFSYSLYLVHPDMLTLGERLMGRVPHSFGLIPLWAFTITAAWIFYMCVERHFIAGSVDRWVTDQWTARRRTASESA